MKTHYDPFYSSMDEDYAETAWCGTNVGEDYEGTNNEDYVTCKKCLKSLPKIKQHAEAINKHRSEQDEAFVDFIFEERYNCECGFKGCMDQLKYEVEEVTFEPLWKCPNCETILQRN